jgi:hypothetical protein
MQYRCWSAYQKAGLESEAEALEKACFEWVRDEIRHSYDYQMNPVTCRASDVLEYKTGYCFAKSHLLAALLRANQIPFNWMRLSGYSSMVLVLALKGRFLKQLLPLVCGKIAIVAWLRPDYSI